MVLLGEGQFLSGSSASSRGGNVTDTCGLVKAKEGGEREANRLEDTKDSTQSPNSNSSVSRVRGHQCPAASGLCPNAPWSKHVRVNDRVPSFWSQRPSYGWELKPEEPQLSRLGNGPLIAFNNPNRLCHLFVFLIHGVPSSQQLTAGNKLWCRALPLILKEGS